MKQPSSETVKDNLIATAQAKSAGKINAATMLCGTYEFHLSKNLIFVQAPSTVLHRDLGPLFEIL